MVSPTNVSSDHPIGQRAALSIFDLSRPLCVAAGATIAEAGIAASCIIGGVGRAAEDGIFPEEMTAMTQVELAELHLCQYYRREAIQTEIRNTLIAFASFNLLFQSPVINVSPYLQ